MKMKCVKLVCIAIETIQPGRLPTNSLADQRSLLPTDESETVELHGEHGDDETSFSLEVDSRYHVSFQRVNASDAGATAKELMDDTGLGEQDEELPGHFFRKGGNRRAVAGPGGRLSTVRGTGHRRVVYPGAPRSMVSGGNGWTDVDEHLPSYILSLRRYPRLYAARGGRLLPAVWPRRVRPSRERLYTHSTDLPARLTTTSTIATSFSSRHASTIDNTSVTSTPPSTTSSTTTKTTTTTTKRTSTTGDEQRQELAAAVHDMRQVAALSNDKKVFVLDVGAPEIGECSTVLLSLLSIFYDFSHI